MKRVVVFIVLAMVVIGSCTAQSSTSAAQKLVGTWTDIEGYEWVFSADGKLKYDDDEYKYSVFDGDGERYLPYLRRGVLFRISKIRYIMLIFLGMGKQ